ncbi:hypothetical protein AB0F88_43970 [Streptosporangium sp. NPDC023963]|uniref:hypothetical protein n=1 Tax=Streptosporangium sp. NPDC023963 TaxID=3155608 RepID=UPI003434817D
MSLTSGLKSPRTPLRRFLDREVTAGSTRLRANYRARLPLHPPILPGEGVGYEAGTVGTAIDQRLRLAFTCAEPVDAATVDGIKNCLLTARTLRGQPWQVIAEVGQQLAEQLTTAVAELQLDGRGQPMMRADDDEERLARMLLAAAWYALNYRNPFAFPDTPLCKAALADPRGFTLKTLLAVPHRHLVDDLLAQLHAAEDGALNRLRARTPAELCRPGPTFDGSAYVSADADLIADGVLVEFKSTRNIHAFDLVTIQQLLGYTLMDYTDAHRIDQVAVYLSRAGTFINWPLEDYLALLGTRRRDLVELRTVFATLLAYEGCRADDDPLPHQLADVERLLADLVAPVPAGCCLVCAQPLAAMNFTTARIRRYCSAWYSQRAVTLRRRGWLTLPD